jgi:putative transposase
VEDRARHPIQNLTISATFCLIALQRFGVLVSMKSHRAKLPRLQPEAYRGTACVHWTMCVDQRATGWLSPVLHLSLREILLHACVRSHCVIPVYCIMPDHAHFLVLGAHPEADSRTCGRLLRTGWNRLLPEGFRLQKQAYDHVLRQQERERDAFAAVAWYILENPVRAGLCEQPEAWRFSGTIFPGYPSLDFRQSDFWDLFWKVYYRVAEKNGTYPHAL